MYRSVFILLAAAFLSLPALAADETPDAFRIRVEQAFHAEDKEAAIRALFYQQGLEDDMKEEVIKEAHLLSIYAPPPAVQIGTLKGDPAVNVQDGYEYRPNLEPLGVVTLEGGKIVENGVTIQGAISKTYGLHEGRHYLTARMRKAVSGALKKDIMLMMMVMSKTNDPSLVEGWCDVMQGDGRLKRLEIKTNAKGNISRGEMGQHIEQCELERKSGTDDIMVHLSDGDKDLLMKTYKASEKKISYQRP